MQISGMNRIPGYTLTKRLDELEERGLFRAVRDRDGARVLVRLFKGRSATTRAQREFAALRAVESPLYVRALELDVGTWEPFIVLAPVEGMRLHERLRDGPLGEQSWLAVAAQLVDAVGQLHRHRLLHLLITPRVVSLGESGQIVLLDAGRGTGVGQGLELRTASGADWRYVAPEQTGRMDRGCDLRTDLYSIGAVLYEALCGQPPFRGDTPLDLMHAHMAKVPDSPLRHCPQIPPTLARIVLKLLEKEPTARYQTTEALSLDLRECTEQLARGAIREDFTLATRDAPCRPLFGKQVFGRTSETRALRAAYEGARAGCRLIVLSGPPGIGKSALCNTLAAELARTKGCLAHGKFDLYRRETPYSAFVAALSSLVQQLLAESSENFESWCSDFRKALGKLSGVLCDFVPDVQFFVGDCEAPAATGAREARERLGLAVRRMISVCARPKHPLVLVLDDLQWADSGSLFLLESLLLSPQIQSLLIIGTYRDAELGPDHILLSSLERIRRARVPMDEVALEPLGQEATAEMLADAFGRELDAVRSIAALIGVRAGNNPFLVQQLVHHLHEQGLIRFETGVGWTGDEAAIAAADIPDDVVTLMTAKLRSLTGDQRGVLCFASCVGDEFDCSTLVELEVGLPPEEVDRALYALSTEGLVAPSQAGYRFVHDRIREAAQGFVSDEKRATLHYRAGRRIWDRTPHEDLEARSFEILDHLNRALHLVAEEDRFDLIELNLRAARRAMGAGAATTARWYLDAAVSKFRDSDWHEHAAAAFEVHLMDGEIAFAVQDYEHADRVFSDLAARDLTDLQFGRVYAHWTFLYGLTREPIEGVKLGISALRRLGVSLTPTPSPLRVYWAALGVWLRARRLDETTFGPLNPDQYLPYLPVQLILGALIAPAYRHSFGLQTLISAAALEGALRCGSRSVAFSLSGNAMLLAHYLCDYRLSKRIAELCFHYLKAQPHQYGTYQARLSLYALILPWIAGRHESIPRLEQVRDEALEAGDTGFAIYADSLNAQLIWLVGTPLREVERVRQGQLDSFSRMGYSDWFQSVVVLRAFHELTGTELPELPNGASWDDDLPDHARPQVASAWIQCCIVFGRDREAFEWSEQVIQIVDRVGCTMPHLSEYWLLRGVSAARLLGRKEQPSTGHPRAAFRGAQRRYRRWARQAPQSFAHGRDWLDAELARRKREPRRALILFRRAFEQAHSGGYVQHAAMISEAEARTHAVQGRERDAREALKRALHFYEAWGATRKAQTLVQEIESLR